MNIKVGDKLQIHCYKHDGKLNSISDWSVVLDETDEYLICGNYHAKLTDVDGSSHRTKEPAIIFFYKKNWFNVIAQFKSFGLFYYCNIATPYIIDEHTIKYIDYDLDLRVFNDGSYKVLDKNEFNYHKKLMHYSDDLIYVIENELQYLIKLSKSKTGPFDKNTLHTYLEKLKEFNENDASF